MRTLLVLAEHPELAEAVQAAANPERFRMLHRLNAAEAEPLLVHGLVDACILDLDLTSVQAIWALEKLRRRAPRCPVIVFSNARQPEWEEEAVLQGVSQVLSKPLRPRLFAAVLERLWPAAQAVTADLLPATHPASAFTPPESPALVGSAGVSASSQLLPVLRNFSGILTQSLNAEGMLKQFLLLLRDILSINRAVIFLRQPLAEFGGAAGLGESRRLRAVSSVGLSQGLLEHIELSLDAGIGSQLLRLGR
ncbi:MAG TPA: response regulator, partial [Verrucomicrobiae bacterium]